MSKQYADEEWSKRFDNLQRTIILQNKALQSLKKEMIFLRGVVENIGRYLSHKTRKKWWEIWKK